MNKGTKKVDFWLQQKDLGVVVNKSFEDQVSLHQAMTTIIREWVEHKENEPLLSASEPSEKLSFQNGHHRHMVLSKQADEKYKNQKTIYNTEYLEDRMTYIEGWFSILYDEILELPIWEIEEESN